MQPRLQSIIICFTLALTLPGHPQTSSWGLVTEPQLPEIGYLGALNFVTANIGYLVGTNYGESIIFKTVDGGVSWTVLYRDSTPFSFQNSYFLDAQTGWVVGTQGRIWFTSDGGQSWQERSTQGNHHLRAIYAASPTTIYVAGDSGVVLKSTNGGLTWSNLSWTNSLHFRDICGFDSLRVILVSSQTNKSFYVTQNGGNSWSLVTPPYHYSMTSNKIYRCRGLPGGTAYAVGMSGGIFKTSDYGATWQYLTTFFPYTNKIITALWVDAAGTVWCGNEGRIFRSADGGVNWDTLHIPTFSRIARIASFGDTVHVFTYGGHLFTSTDGGGTFGAQLNWPNIPFSALGWNGSQIFAVSDYGGEMSVSHDGGFAWNYPTNTLPQSVSGINALWFTDSLHGFYCGKGGQIGRTVDGGSTWELVPNFYFYPNSAQNFHFVYFKDSLNGFVGGDMGALLSTQDGGGSWELVNLNSSASLFACTFVDSSTGFLTGRKMQNGAILKTTDGGLTWQETLISDSAIYLLRDIEFLTQNLGFAISSNGYVLRTADKGNTWHILPRLHNFYAPEQPPDLRMFSLTPTGTMFIGGSEGAFYVSADSGQSWQQISTPPQVRHLRLHSMVWLDATNALIGCDNGYILGFTYTGIQGGNIPSGNFVLLPGYPNPFNSITTMEFYLPKSTTVRLTIYNSLGQKVRSLFRGFLIGGWHRFQWDGRNDVGLNVPSGVYFLKVQSQEYRKVVKLTYVR